MSDTSKDGAAGGGFSRAGRAARLWWRRFLSVPNDPIGIGATAGLLALVILPFAVAGALLADVLAYTLGGVLRAGITFAFLGVVGGLVLAFVVSRGTAEAEELLMTAALAALGAGLAGIVIGFLAGPIFRELPRQIDNDLETLDRPPS